MNTRARILMTAIVILLGGSAHAQGTRDVSYTDRAIVSVQAKLRFTTLIILPEGERILDFVCGVSYMLYLIAVFAVGTLFWFKDRALMSRLAFAFLVVNLLGILTWMSFPAAPPWYVEQYGLGPAVMDALPSAAGAARFDQLDQLQ